MNYQNKSLFKTLSVAVLTLSFSFSSLVNAQEEEENRFANAETTKVKAITANTAKKMEPGRACLAPEPEVEDGPVPEPDGTCALIALDKIRTDNLPGYEQAEIWNLYGYAHYLLDDTAKTKEYYLKVVNEPEANAPLRNRTLKTVAQLYMIEDNFPQALKYYLEWMSLQQILGAPDYATLAIIYYNMNDQNNALKSVETAIEMRESKGEIGQENWYGIQKSIYYERNNFNKVISILDLLINNYPNVRYWREISGMYAELERPRDQLGAFMTAYLQGGLTTQNQVVGLAYMYLSAEVPYKAAQILIKGVDSGLVEDSEKNLQLIGSAFYQAAELQKALPWMEKAAAEATDGESYGRLASIYVDLERFSDAIRTAEEAVRRGNVPRMDLVRMTKGSAEFNLKRYDDAIKSFRAIKDPRSIKSAADWIRYVEAEKKRDRQLRDSGIDLDKIRAS